MVASIKERRTRILLTLFLLGKDNFHDLFSQKVMHVFALPSDSARSRGTLRQMLSDAIIEKEATGVYHITEAGVAELALSFPFVRFLVFPWDGKFRILSYEIPEKQRKYRDSLRREVSGWGLGPWHRSFWVTPHPIIGNLKKLTQGTSLELYVQAFEGAQVVGEVKTLLEKVWNLPALEAQYRKAFKNWHEYLSNESFTKEQKMRSVVDSYLEVLKTDPGLPPELVGKTWIGAEAWDIFQEMRNILVT